jgi:FtsH-binding integral membrane protein
MSYAYDFGPVAQAAPSARAAFIRRTYGHLAGAVLAFAILETLLLQVPGIEQLVFRMAGSGLSWIVVLLAFMGVSHVARTWARSDVNRNTQYAGLALFVFAEAIIFLPLLYLAKVLYPQAILTAAVLTGAVFGGLTCVVFVTRHDYSYLGPILSVGVWIALGAIVAGLIFGFSLGLFFCFAMVALICGFILYDTSMVLHHFRTDQHVAAALELFASVAILFWYILRIVMSSRD